MRLASRLRGKNAGASHLLITAVNLATTRNTSLGTTTFVTPSITPAANKLILAVVAGESNLTSAAPTLSGCGLTWVQVATVVSSGGDDRLTLFRAMGAAPTTGAVTATFAQSQNGGHIVIDQFTNCDITGTNGSGAVVQSAVFGPATTGAPSVALSAFANAANATYGAFTVGNTNGFAVGAGFTALANDIQSGPSNSILTEFTNANDTSVDATTTSSTEVRGLAVELAAA